MTFIFLHTADWQIGKAFAGLPSDVAAALRDARISAIDRIAETAVRVGARHVLAAGDVFDADTLAPKTVRQAIARMAGQANITWHLLPGNHDAHRAGGLWERLVREGLPTNVRTLLTPQPIEIAPQIWLLPAPLTGRATSNDPTLFMDTAPTPSGATRIGLAHGSVRGFGSEDTAAVTIARDRARIAGLDYLALGDWHGTQEAAAKTWYSGTPEPDRFHDNDPGYVLAVETAPGAPPRVDRVATAQFAWLKHSQNVVHDPVLAFPRPANGGGASLPPHNTLLQLTLTGRVTAERRQAILQELRHLEAGLRHLEANLSGLTLGAGPLGLDALSGCADLERIAGRLVARASAAASPDAALATEALSILMEFAAEDRTQTQ